MTAWGRTTAIESLRLWEAETGGAYCRGPPDVASFGVPMSLGRVAGWPPETPSLVLSGPCLCSRYTHRGVHAYTRLPSAAVPGVCGRRRRGLAGRAADRRLSDRGRAQLLGIFLLFTAFTRTQGGCWLPSSRRLPLGLHAEHGGWTDVSTVLGPRPWSRKAHRPDCSKSPFSLRGVSSTRVDFQDDRGHPWVALRTKMPWRCRWPELMMFSWC